jgi:putative RecB family exonuclease
VTEYSHSRLSTYENCPRQFKYKYIDQLKVEGEGVEAFVGKRVHEILERLYHHVARHGRPPSLGQVLDRFRQDFSHAWHDKIAIVRAENPRSFYEDLGGRCLENYYRSFYPFSHGETVALEARLRIALDTDGRYRAVGIVDRIVKSGVGTFEIHDYKTGGYLPPQRRVDQDRQLALYQIGLEQTYPEVKEVELVWHYLAFNRTLRSRRSPEALAELRDSIVRLIDTIEAESEFAPKPGPLCRWCDFAELCEGAPAEVRSAAQARGVLAPLPPPAPPEADGVQLSLLGD